MLPTTPKLANAKDFKDIPRWLYLWLPLVFLLTAFITAAIDRPLYQKLFRGEDSLTEIGTVLVLIVATIYGLRSLLLIKKLSAPFLFIWVLMGTLGCFYFGGEEASWGQWLFGWATPEMWQAVNDQNETNLHNLDKLGPFLDQLPRALLTIGAVIGGIFAPLYLWLRRTSLSPSAFYYWIFPTSIVAPAATIAVLISKPERLIPALQGTPWATSALGTGEFKELYLGIFLMLYMTSLYLRLQQLNSAIRS